HRGQGIGKQLMLALMQYAANLGADYLTLEVRRSNTVAQALYKKLGFMELAVRKRYYEDNGEDALLLVCDHMPPVEADFSEA
ncbi:MAG: GNAT family N-acetyltransferase, partial [Candidatus Limiplasma sp.]|nr:GNAT family N-acetyltransferase [Candidatus Limiplasma sp.]